MLMTTFFKLGKKWKQPKCLSSGEWIHKIQYIQIKESFLEEAFTLEILPMIMVTDILYIHM